MFTRAGMLSYRTHDASLVRHQVARNSWQLPREGGGGGATPITFPEASEDAAKYTAYIVSHMDELEVNVCRWRPF